MGGYTPHRTEKRVVEMISAIALDAAVSLGGLVAPPLFDFLKKKFVKAENDTPERTMGTLATTNPDALPGYVDSLAKLFKSKVEWFNRDVIGAPSQWIVDLRAAIRPLVVSASVLMMIGGGFDILHLTDGMRYFAEVNTTSWMGSRLVQR